MVDRHGRAASATPGRSHPARGGWERHSGGRSVRSADAEGMADHAVIIVAIAGVRQLLDTTIATARASYDHPSITSPSTGDGCAETAATAPQAFRE
jgi:hypothetical protein